MEQEAIAQLADWFEAHKDGITDRSTKLDKTKIFTIIDNLQLFDQPVSTYLEMTEDQYDESASDHRFTIENGDQKLAALKDRILLNHLDGTVDTSEMNFAYNHENAYQDGYQVKVDLNILTYALEVLGAAYAIVPLDVIQENLSKDAAMSLAIAAESIDHWQNRQAN